jgi:hypothetical protein
MSWWRGQNLDRPLTGPDGTTWHFLVWHGRIGGVDTQRIYFWDETRVETGLLDLTDDQTIHIRRLKDRLRRLAADSEYRRRFLRPLEFPIERHWPPDGS